MPKNVSLSLEKENCMKKMSGSFLIIQRRLCRLLPCATQIVAEASFFRLPYSYYLILNKVIEKREEAIYGS